MKSPFVRSGLAPTAATERDTQLKTRSTSRGPSLNLNRHLHSARIHKMPPNPESLLVGFGCRTPPLPKAHKCTCSTGKQVTGGADSSHSTPDIVPRHNARCDRRPRGMWLDSRTLALELGLGSCSTPNAGLCPPSSLEARTALQPAVVHHRATARH